MSHASPPDPKRPIAGVCSKRSLNRFMKWDASLPGELTRQLWQNHTTLLAGGEQLHRKLRCTVARIDSASGEYILKRQTAGPAWRRLRRSLAESPSSRSWRLAHQLCAAGVATPRPRAITEETIGPFCSASSLLMDYVPGTTLYRLVRHGAPPKECIEDIARQLARIWNVKSRLGVCHNDFKPENLVVDTNNKVWLIDLDRMKQERAARHLISRQAENLRSLLHPRCWSAAPDLFEAFREALIRSASFAETLRANEAAGRVLRQPLPTGSQRLMSVTVLIACPAWSAGVEACVDAARDLASEIIVACAGGSTAAPAGFADCRVLHRPSVSIDPLVSIDALEAWAQGRVTGYWTLRLRANERLTPELSRQLQDAIAAAPDQDGFEVACADSGGRGLLSGRRVPPPSVRLYRTDRAGVVTVDGAPRLELPTPGPLRPRSRLLTLREAPAWAA